MGKRSKSVRAEKRKQAKRAAKAARKALYLSYAGTGRRAKKRNKASGPTAQRGNHVMSNCGNIGCSKCFPQYACKPANVG